MRKVLIAMGQLAAAYAPDLFEAHSEHLAAAAAGLEQVWGADTGAFSNLAVCEDMQSVNCEYMQSVCIWALSRGEGGVVFWAKFTNS